MSSIERGEKEWLKIVKQGKKLRLKMKGGGVAHSLVGGGPPTKGTHIFSNQIKFLNLIKKFFKKNFIALLKEL